MIDLPLAFLTALLLGMRHATDADHVVAVSTIVSRERSVVRAATIGAVWGLGHTLTIFVAGGAILAFKWTISARVGLSLEFTVALMLVTLGVLNLAPHRHAAVATWRLRPFLVGVVHGLAGSAALALLVLPLIDDVRIAVTYLAVFGAGTVIGMAIVTFALAAPAAWASRRLDAFGRGLRLASGALSLAFGLWLGYRIGFVDGLFTGAPQWTPR
ncbi:MAG: high-affinity nickel-transport family protein [Gemmatimonadota bacterium]|nr:high-affinity nickel-transport family protein [Gemmatimonadota bacterium]